jgi:hypothetical protein
MLVHARDINLTDTHGRTYGRAYVYAEPQSGGTTWQGWIEFTSENEEDRPAQTDRETTQSTLEGVAYWASGLETTYLQGALNRAVHRGSDLRSAAPPPEPLLARAAEFRLVSLDPDVPFRLMATRTLVPGARRYIHNGGVIVYHGARRDARGATAGVYEFSAQFGSDAAAALMANRMWSDLLGLGARLEIGGVEVPLDHVAIRDAILSAALV